MANAVKHRRPGAMPSVAIVCSVEERTATLRLVNPGCLPADFDFDSRQGLGTGLRLVASLMPPGGARISWEQRENVVLTVLELAPPVIVVEEEMEPVT